MGYKMMCIVYANYDEYVCTFLYGTARIRHYTEDDGLVALMILLTLSTIHPHVYKQVSVVVRHVEVGVWLLGQVMGSTPVSSDRFL